jgi:hypothetical protein
VINTQVSHKMGPGSGFGKFQEDPADTQRWSSNFLSKFCFSKTCSFSFYPYL